MEQLLDHGFLCISAYCPNFRVISVTIGKQGGLFCTMMVWLILNPRRYNFVIPRGIVAQKKGLGKLMNGEPLHCGDSFWKFDYWPFIMNETHLLTQIVK